MPVSTKEVGSLAASNVMTVCANHHRQLHYGEIDVTITEKTFEFVIATIPMSIPRLGIPGEEPDIPVLQTAICFEFGLWRTWGAGRANVRNWYFVTLSDVVNLRALSRRTGYSCATGSYAARNWRGSSSTRSKSRRSTLRALVSLDP